MEYKYMANKGFFGVITIIISSITLFSYSINGYADQNQASQSDNTDLATTIIKQTSKTDRASLLSSQFSGSDPVIELAMQTAVSDPMGETTTMTTAPEGSAVPTPEESINPEDIIPAQPVETHDPYEGFNRIMFDFNDRVDTTVLKPVATFYNKIMPRPLNEGIHNIYNNLNNLPTIANDLLQLHFHQLASDVWRFGINSTIGIGGIFDVAGRMNLQQYNNDFGLTLARYGYTNSNYLVLPFFGPNTVRDGIGIPVDYYGFSIYPYVEPPSARYELYGVGVIDKRAQLLQYQQVFEEAALDKYVFVRNAYLHRRAFQIDQNDHRTAADLKKQPAQGIGDEQA